MVGGAVVGADGLVKERERSRGREAKSHWRAAGFSAGSVGGRAHCDATLHK